MSELDDAIEHLYAVFRPYRAGRVAGCPCCVSREEQQRLHSKRLRELAGDDLSAFAFSSLYTWGTLKDFKHFLPRMLELCATGELRTDPQTIYGKFVHEGPWPAEERAALERFTLALLVEALYTTPIWRPRPLDVIEAAGLAGMDLRELLDRAFGTSGGPLDAQRASRLAELVLERGTAMSSGEPGWIWWKAEGADALDRWLVSGRAYDALMSAFCRDPDHPSAGDWAAACDVLEALGGKR